MISINDKSFKLENKTVVIIGKLDGIHKGHRKLLRKARELAVQENLSVAVFTFDTPPGAKLGYAENRVITSHFERNIIFEREGADIEVEYPFDNELREMEPLDFIEKILKDKMNAVYIVAGSDWCFGKDRKGDANTLKAAQKLFGYTAIILDKEKYMDREISSTWVREEITKGNMENVNILLDHPYSIMGKVVHGNNLGSNLGFPTINIIPDDEKLLPPNGVYASRVNLGGKHYYSISNIGVKPTVSDGNTKNIETFIIDYEGDLYDSVIEVMLYHFQRPEMKFENTDKLVAQVEKDVEFTRNFFMIKKAEN